MPSLPQVPDFLVTLCDTHYLSFFSLGLIRLVFGALSFPLQDTRLISLVDFGVVSMNLRKPNLVILLHLGSSPQKSRHYSRHSTLWKRIVLVFDGLADVKNLWDERGSFFFAHPSMHRLDSRRVSEKRQQRLTFICKATG